MHERKHKVAKAFANVRTSETGSDKGLLEDVIYCQLRSLDRPLFRPALSNEQPAADTVVAAVEETGCFPAPLCNSITTGASLTVNCREVMCRDVVLFRTEGRVAVGQVYFLVNANGQHMVCMSEWQIVERHASRLLCRVLDDPKLYDATCIAEAVIFTTAQAGQLSHVLVNHHLMANMK